LTSDTLLSQVRVFIVSAERGVTPVGLVVANGL
jgi:hypothetical protein